MGSRAAQRVEPIVWNLLLVLVVSVLVEVVVGVAVSPPTMLERDAAFTAVMVVGLRTMLRFMRATTARAAATAKP